MGVIATLIPTQPHLQRLRTAIRDRHQLVLCDDWQAVLDTCESQPVRLAIVDLFAGGRTGFENVRQLKQRLPRLTMIAYVSVTSDRAHDLFDAGRQGMDGLIIAEQDDSPRALLALVEQAESRSLAAGVGQAGAEGAPPAGAPRARRAGGVAQPRGGRAAVGRRRRAHGARRRSAVRDTRARALVAG